jgi:hypothetical protein
MRQRNVRDAVSRTRVANRRLERDLAPEAIDGETAQKKDHPRSEKRELRIEPRSAERDLGRRWATIAASGRRLSGKAFRDGGAVGQVVLVDPGLREPATKLCARTSAERLPCSQLDRAGRLADDRDAVANGSSDDGAGTLEITRCNAFRAGSDARVKICEPELIRVAARSGRNCSTSRCRAG